jgi:hypothetical protein
LAYPASLGRLVSAEARSNQIGNHAFGYTFLVSFSSADCCERRRCVPAKFDVRVAPARDEPRSESNNSDRGPTSGRSTNYASGHLIRVFRDIGRIFSLLFLLQPTVARWSAAEREGFTEYGFVEGKNGFNCDPSVAVQSDVARAGSREYLSGRESRSVPRCTRPEVCAKYAPLEVCAGSWPR